MFKLYEIRNPNTGSSNHVKIKEGPRGILGPLMQKLYEANRVNLKNNSRTVKCKYALYDVNNSLVGLTGG